MTKTCGDMEIQSGRDGVPGAYAFVARYLLMPWESCLDVGGGMGKGRSILQTRSPRVKSIDQDPRLAQFGVEVGDVQDEKDDSFDWVVAVDVVEHVEDDGAFIGHLWRIARKGVFVTTPNLENHPTRNWPYHVREYSPVQIRDLLIRATGCRHMMHFGGGVYGGSLAMGNLSPNWELQALVCFKKPCVLLRMILFIREGLVRTLRRQSQSGV